MQYYEVTINGLLVTEQVVNRLCFKGDTTGANTPTAFFLTQALGWDVGAPETPAAGLFFDEFLSAQTTSYNIESIFVRNLWNVEDFFEFLTAGESAWQGGLAIAAGDRAPTFVASKLRTNRVRTDIRRGTLALTGGTEEHIEGSDVWNSTYMGLLTAVANELNAPPTWPLGGGGVQYFPCVFSKERYPVPDTDPVRYAYRYYEDFEDFEAHVATDVTWAAVEQVSSQVSRKIGRGS